MPNKNRNNKKFKSNDNKQSGRKYASGDNKQSGRKYSSSDNKRSNRNYKSDNNGGNRSRGNSRPIDNNRYSKNREQVDNDAFLGYRPMDIYHKKDPKVKIACPYFKDCGGCQLLDVTYNESLRLKQSVMINLFKEYGKVDQIIGMDDPYSYRNKSVATFRFKKEQFFSGMYKANSRDLVPIDRCLIQDERADAIVLTIRSLMKSFKLTAYNELTGRGFLRHVLIRIGKRSNEIMVVFVTTDPVFRGKNNFIKVMKERHPEITTMVMNLNDKDTSMVLGDRDIVLYGKGFISDELCGLKFRISPQSFYQINPVQTEALYKKALEFADLKGDEVVLDAYSGIGTIGLIAAGQCKNVIGVELNGDAVRDAIGNAKGNKINNARFYTGDAGDFMVNMAEQGEKLDVVFMDPPRSGSSKEFIKAIGISKPKKVVYVSCGPESLKRDLGWLEEAGYKVSRIQPVDMFPWTNHCEVVVGLSRKH